MRRADRAITDAGQEALGRSLSSGLKVARRLTLQLADGFIEPYLLSARQDADQGEGIAIHDFILVLDESAK